MSFSPSSLLWLGSQSIQLHWESWAVGFQFYLLLNISVVWFCFFFLPPPSPLTCLLPQTPISSLFIKVWWALFSFNPKSQETFLSLTWVFFFTSASSLFTPQYPKPWWTILNSLPPWVGARREEKLRGLLWVWATSFELHGWQSAGAVDPEGKKGDSSF